MKNLLPLVAAAVMALSLCTIVQAAPVGLVLFEKVRFADLDINQDADAAILFRRIQRAAGRVCDSLGSTTLFMRRAYIDCRQLAIDDAVAQVNHPTFSAYARTQGSTPKRIRLAAAAGFREIS
jgi:UrcA family protein